MNQQQKLHLPYVLSLCQKIQSEIDIKTVLKTKEKTIETPEIFNGFWRNSNNGFVWNSVCTKCNIVCRKQLCEIINIIKNKKLQLNIVGSINVDCTNGQIDPMTNAFVQMSGVFAELELRIIRERVRSGMQNAKAKGGKIGRPQTTVDEIPQIFNRLSVIQSRKS